MRNTLVTSAFLVLFLLSLLPLATAFSGGDTPQGPPAAIKNFFGILGKWKSKASGTVEGKPVSLDYHVDFKKVADGSGLYMDERFDSKELGKMRGGNLIGFDPADGKIHWFSADNMGTAHEHIGEWESPTRFRMKHTGVQEGKTYVEEITMELLGREKIRFHLTGSLDGSMFEELQGEFTKD